MLVYLGVYSGLALYAVGRSGRHDTFFFVAAALFLIWFMGFRFETGCDFYGYYRRWDNFQLPTSIGELFQGEEAGFALLMGSIKEAGLSYIWLNVAASAILVFCYVKFASAHYFGPLILALLFPIIIIQLGMSGIRQAIAGGFLMLSFNAFIQRQKLWTAAWIFVGMQFHASVVMFLPIALLAGEKVSIVRLASALAILGPVASLFLADRFDTYEDRYFEGLVTSGGAVIRYALIALPVPFFLIYRRRLKAVFPAVYPLLELGALLIASLAPLVILSSIALHRLIFYVMPLSILLCVYVGALIAKKPSEGHWMAALAYGAYSVFWFTLSKHAQLCYVPYRNSWLLPGGFSLM